MYYYMYITYCCILTILICTTDAVNICPSRTILVSTSGTIESPAYPIEYWSAQDCTLNLLIPGQTNIEFRVDGEYDYDVDHYQGRCINNNDHFRLVTPDGTTQLCGKRADNDFLGSYYNDGVSNATITLQFKAKTSYLAGHRFKIKYTVLTTTTTNTTTTSTTTTSTTTTKTTTPEPSNLTVLSTIMSSTTITATSYADSTALTAVFADADSTGLADSSQTSVTLTRNILIGSGVALAIIIVVIVAAVMFRRRQEKSRNNPIVLSTDVMKLNSTTSDYINVDGHVQMSNCGTGEGAVSTNQYASLDLISRENDNRTYADLSLYQNV